MGRFDDKEKRDSGREEFNRKIGKFFLISAFTGLGFYLAYIIPEFIPSSFEFVK